MNTDKKAKKEGFFLSVFICVHPWLNLFVRSRDIKGIAAHAAAAPPPSTLRSASAV
jgi:hypothetical protein